MNVTIRRIVEAGNLEHERIVLDVSVPTDIGEYAVFCSAVDGDTVTTTLKTVFWFPDLEIKAHSTVVLYTKSGSQRERTNKDGTISYFFYWNQKTPLWSPEYAAVVAHIDEWISSLKDEDAIEPPPPRAAARGT